MQMTPTAPMPGGDAAQTTSPNGNRGHRGSTPRPSRRSPWLDVDWREHQRWVYVDGQRVNTVDVGEGPALVFVHGLSGSWPNWLEQVPVFAGLHGEESEFGEHRVIAMDLPGFGHSPMPRKQITISGYARLLEGMLGELQIDTAAVVGNSMGGFVSLELAISCPGRVERLVLVSPAGLSSYRDPRGRRAIHALRVLRPALTSGLGWVSDNAEPLTRHPRLRAVTLGDLVRYPGRVPAPLAAELVRGAGKPGFIDALQASIAYDTRARLPEIACPTLIVWGDRDRVITVRDASVYAELIPNSRKVIYHDTGHLAMVERPEEFNALLRDFLAERS
jgi:pimeloyl-ACP methyl ester carboxylesterase